LWVSEEFLADKPEMIVGAGRALAKVTVFGLENPEKTVRLMWRQHSETRPTPRDLDRALFRDLEIMKARLDSFRIDPSDTDRRWGTIDEREIAAWQEFLLASGAITQKLDLKVFYDDRFVDDFNQFDAEAIKVEARRLVVE
jgi:NitT/TauT family transport system substrate-binding protein